MLVVQTCLLVALFLHRVEAQLYTVNEVVHLACSATDLSMEQDTLSVVRGVTGAPCTGYLKYNSGTVKRLCADGDQIPNTEFAHRACYTLGTNMYRPPAFHASSSDQMMLFTCDMYTEAGVDTPTGTIDVAAVEGGPLTEKRCESAGQNDFCFEDCYDLSTMVTDVEGGDCVSSVPYWATACTDVNECRDGVLADCTGPFPDSCTKRKACGDNTVCTNIADGTGGWTCECSTGYEAPDDADTDPYSAGCEDTDECSEEDVCGHYAQCINTPGSYICACGQPHLYNADTQTCAKAPCTAPPTLPYAQQITPLSRYPTTGATVVYECLPGHKVELYLLPQTLLTSYGYVTITSFQVECSVSGEWTPFPMPICYPVTCSDPGYIPNAVHSTSGWSYQDVVTYTCKRGYRPDERSFGPDTFTRTCKADGTWTQGTTCEDVEECVEQPGICGAVAKYCINTVGSYMCSCVPWFQRDPTDSKCIDEDAAIPDIDPCELISSLSYCKSGNCYVEDGKARCRCYTGFVGAACDIAVFNTRLLLALTALVLVVLLCIILILLCCYSYCIKPAVLPAKH